MKDDFSEKNRKTLRSQKNGPKMSKTRQKPTYHSEMRMSPTTMTVYLILAEDKWKNKINVKFPG